MRCMIPEISWHNREPVLCIDFQPLENNEFYRLATGGSDCHVLIWHVRLDEKGTAHVEIAADLTRHQRAVNAVKWSPNCVYLATADDDANILIWSLKNDNIPCLDGDNTIDKEIWIVNKILRGHKEDIYDLCWSPSSEKIITGSIDNTAIIWDITKGKFEHILLDHKGFVQGVSWDPKGQFIATLSSDRICRIFDSTTKQVKARINKGILPLPEDHRLFNKEVKYFHDDTFKSYFRRLCFTPDGNMIIAPSACVETDESKNNLKGTYLFTLDLLTRPVAILPLESQCSVAVRCCPILFNQNPDGPEPFVNLPYRMIIAVATETDIILYDTQQTAPFAHLKNVHYTRLTDVTWSPDGKILAASSTDGFCTLLSFCPEELGVPYMKEETEEEKENSAMDVDVSGVEELEPEQVSVRETPKKSSFLLQWANKAKEDAKIIKTIVKVSIDKKLKEESEKINVLTVRRTPKNNVEEIAIAPRSESTNEEIRTPSKKRTIQKSEKGTQFVTEKPRKRKTSVAVATEVVEIADSPEKMIPPNSDVASRTFSAKPTAVRQKPRQSEISPSRAIKSNSLLTFLSRSNEKPKPVLEETEARDAWICEEKTEKPMPEEFEDITVPDLDLKLEESSTVQEKSVKKVQVVDMKPVTLEKLEQILEKKVPRRVPLITLSSPKQKK